MPFRRQCSVAGILALVLAALLGPAFAASGADERLHGPPTGASSPELIALHDALTRPAKGDRPGLPISNAVWEAPGFRLVMHEGTLHPEPAVDGAVVSGVFEGRASVSFDPQDRDARAAMSFWFDSAALTEVPISNAYLFSLRGQSLLSELGLSGKASGKLGDRESYAVSKDAFRRLGLGVVAAFLERDGKARGAAYAVFAPEWLLRNGNPEARLIYSHVPHRRKDVHLLAYGHEASWKHSGENRPDRERYRSLEVVRYRSRTGDHVPACLAEAYHTRLDATGGSSSEASLETEITTFPTRETGALLLRLTPRMEVERVADGNGTAMDFMQWEPLDPVFPGEDRHLLVRAPEPLARGESVTLEISARGDLFEPTRTVTAGSVWRLVDEDAWYPQLVDRSAARYEQVFRIPKRYEAVGVGKQISLEEHDDFKEYRFRTSHPARRATFYYGNFMSREGQADDLPIEVFVDVEERYARKRVDHVVTEVENAVKVYNRILNHPLELDRLRVVGIPGFHGRGFEGLVLLSIGGFRADLSASELFRAHEVAHQWWGNIVEPEDWRTDRWIGEAFAEYMSMEYYAIRHENPDKTRRRIYENWVRPLLDAPTVPVRRLDGTTEMLPEPAAYALCQGTDLVYTKGPMVLHMLRFLFRTVHGSDSKFWLLLQDFIANNQYTLVSTEDFEQMASRYLGAELTPFFDQWLRRPGIPSVRWSHDVRRGPDGHVLVLDAEQDMDFDLFLPVHIELRGGRVVRSALVMQGGAGHAEIRLPGRPRDVTLNEDWEALADVSER
jgi:hypothetical protein